jgi:hypothetical protein
MNKNILGQSLMYIAFCLLLFACKSHQMQMDGTPPTPPTLDSQTPIIKSETITGNNTSTPIAPYPEQKIYTSQYNLTLQIPSDWQPQDSRQINVDDGSFYLGPPEDALVQSGGPEGLDQDDICNALLESNMAMGNELGYQPYGKDPQLEFIEVDGQPACILMPSIDQDEAAGNKAEFIIRFPPYFPSNFHTPPFFGFIQLTANSQYIQDVAQTLHFTQSQAAESDFEEYSPNVIGKLELDGQRVSSLSLDENFIYWTQTVEQSPISRYSFESSIIDNDYLTTQFDGGTLGYIDPSSRNHGLVYLDVDLAAKDFGWVLQVRDLQDDTKQQVLEVNDNKSWPGPNVDFDGNSVAWTYTLQSDNQACTKSVLGITNVNTGEQKIIEEQCADDGPYLWSAIGISRNFLIVEQDLPDNQGAGNDLFLYDLQNEQLQQLTDNGHSSMPVISYPWIVWKNAPRFEWGRQDVIYNLQNQTQQVINVPGNGATPDPRLEGDWLYWNIINDKDGTGIVYFYNLEQNQMWEMAAPHQGEVFDDVAFYGDMIAWSRRPLEGQGQSDSIVEWANLP